ncbi:hypothetical protein PV10_04644 [Exophiala mesophila]|uniref:Zn(2)-C6 fungal-type domain-containing protein n=1 Tax=Exophiala mesophila TaxID=212818 RepID=A0A0D1XYX6_EXOME|nr:uncharacterized protein PV10_04644 [Exophiala mesophila]KIV93431.1 hypothetical protein PV10_04644 [Exophiala mesophila]
MSKSTPRYDISLGVEGAESRKRRYISGAFTSRKRAAIACSFCRLRKTRCDNALPRCGACCHHDATCIYDEGDEVGRPGDERHSDLVQRLDEIKECLQQMQRAGGSPAAYGSASQNGRDLRPSIPTPAGPNDTTMGVCNELDEAGGAVDPYASPYRAARCEAVCRWPIFDGWIDDSAKTIESFLHQATVMVSDANCEDSHVSRLSPTNVRSLVATSEIDLRDVIPLCRSFLGHVHFRNPILDPRKLMQSAKQVAQNGFEWDTRSCLVLIICAISCILSGETPPSDHMLTHPDDAPKLPVHIQKDPVGFSEAYLQEAKKRVGLLEMSVPDIECFFFLSIYEKLRIRPLQSWYHLRQASMRLKAYLMSHTGHKECHDYARDGIHEVVPRVFWSCVRAEIELLPDMCLPSSGLDKFEYPDFPAPPAIAPSAAILYDPNEDSNVDPVPEPLQEQSWLFFLAEISLRRTINANLRLIYPKSESYWLSHPCLLLKHYSECEEQIRAWHSHLPARLKLDATATQYQSLSFYLESRFQDWREYILRPLLYCALHQNHQPPTLENGSVTNQASRSAAPHANSHETYVHITRLAQQHVALSAQLIPQAFEHGRYGGTWQLCRRTFTGAMAILASVISPHLQAPDMWRHLCELAIKYLALWSAEAKSVEAMHRVLENLLRRVLDGQGR